MESTGRTSIRRRNARRTTTENLMSDNDSRLDRPRPPPTHNSTSPTSFTDEQKRELVELIGRNYHAAFMKNSTEGTTRNSRKKLKIDENDDAVVPQEQPNGQLPEVLENDLIEVLSNRNPGAVDERKRKAYLT